MNRASFYINARKKLFPKGLTQSQVNGINDVFAEWDVLKGEKDLRHLAYILATIYHETGRQMVPVREGFAKSDASARVIVKKRPYGNVGKYGFVPYGRGRVQITWDDNYKRVGDRFGVPLTTNPDLCLDSKIDAHICVNAMLEGVYTGKCLEDYFNRVKEDPVSARKIINGVDKARVIAEYYLQFLQALA